MQEAYRRSRVSAGSPCQSEHSLGASFYRASEAPRPIDAGRFGKVLLEAFGHEGVCWRLALAQEKPPCSMAYSLDIPSLKVMRNRKRA